MIEQEPAVAWTDESGNLPDPNDRYVAFVAIVTSNPRGLRRVVKKYPLNKSGKVGQIGNLPYVGPRILR